MKDIYNKSRMEKGLRATLSIPPYLYGGAVVPVDKAISYSTEIKFSINSFRLN